ncbi:hypothetical protein L7F22_018487 [Adiantum nelumboides]|nr:hypothetical protein [Adiantum nelumboides]
MVVSRDDKFELHKEDFNGELLVRIWCHECGVLYGKGSIEGNQAAYNCCSNFKRTHILESTRHEMKYMVARGLRKEDMPKVVNQPQKDDRKDIEVALEKLRSLMATNEGWDFEVVEATLHDFKDKRWNVNDDTLVGFDGYKTDDHECMTTCMIKVGEGQKSYDTIVDAFQNCVVGGQWDAISSLWNEKLWPRIGSKLGIPWKGWPLSAKMVDNGVIGLHDQDFEHNGKKLVNVLDKPERQLAIGDVWITLNRVLIVYDAFSIDKHMLRKGDIRRDDCQNWVGAQKICSRQVQCCLGELANNGNARKEQSMLETKAYLEVVGDYIDIFLSQHLNLVERVHLPRKVSFFQIWRPWISQHPHYTLTINFITKEAFLDVQLSCHFVVFLIKCFGDFYLGLKCPLHLLGSDAAEIFFSKIGSMVGQERSYDLMDMLHTIGILDRLAHFECKEDCSLFARAHKKQEHVWSELNHNESLPKADLVDYNCVSTDENIINALKKGLESAQAICERFHMKPKYKDKEKMRWWSTPWKNGFVDAFAKMDKLEFDLGEEDLVHAAEEEDSDNETSLSEIRHVVDSLLDEQVIVSPVVSIDSDKCMFKSTLVSQLNGNPTLSKDRLTRVRQGLHYSKKEEAQATSNDNLFGIGLDCIVFFVKEEKNTKSTRQGKPSSIQRKKKTKGTWTLRDEYNLMVVAKESMVVSTGFKMSTFISEGLTSFNVESSFLIEEVNRKNIDKGKGNTALVVRGTQQFKEKKDSDSENAAGDIFLTSSYDFAFLTAEDGYAMSEWIIDFGTSLHVSPYKEWFTSYVASKDYARLGNEQVYDILGVEDVQLKFQNGSSLLLKNVRHVPPIQKSLICMGKLDDADYHYKKGGGGG